MKCPTCKTKLIDIGAGARWCPERHGLLVTANTLKEAGSKTAGAHLMRADQTAPATATAPATGAGKREIYCPNCWAPMIEVDYRGTGIMIDQCFSCPYRWLDAGELTKITRRDQVQGRLRSDQLLALEGLESALKQHEADSTLTD